MQEQSHREHNKNTNKTNTPYKIAPSWLEIGLLLTHNQIVDLVRGGYGGGRADYWRLNRSTLKFLNAISPRRLGLFKNSFLIEQCFCRHHHIGYSAIHWQLTNR